MADLKKFTVTVVETVEYTIELEAEHEEDAGVAARAMWENSEDPTHDFCGQGRGIEITSIEEA